MDDGLDLEDVLGDAYPRCELCDAQLEPTGERDHPYWRCPDCAAASISR